MAGLWHGRYLFINVYGKLSFGQVWLLLDTYDGQCAQLFHIFTIYVKGATPLF